MIALRNRPMLVVEDCDEDWATVQQAARRAGFESHVCRAGDGEAGLGLLRGVGGAALTPSLVLLDLNLPGIDGHAVLAAIKSDAALKELPVVVFTTTWNPRDVASCYAAGANAFHVKPMRYDAHLRALQSLFAYWLDSASLPEPRWVVR